MRNSPYLYEALVTDLHTYRTTVILYVGCTSGVYLAYC
eukprot:SAG11_NODE_31973_length_287_cov_1.101064_1_plen_37_part_10